MQLSKIFSLSAVLCSLCGIVSANAESTINNQPFYREMALGWTPADSDTENASVALAQYLNEHLTTVAKLSRVAICFNSSSTAEDCKDTEKGIEQSVFSASLLKYDPSQATILVHLVANKVFVFGSSNNHNYEGDIEIKGGFTIDGCKGTMNGATPTFTFSNEGNSKLSQNLINSLHGQFTANSKDVVDSFLNGYTSEGTDKKKLPGFLASCQ